jgi:hypothetical protein
LSTPNCATIGGGGKVAVGLWKILNAKVFDNALVTEPSTAVKSVGRIGKTADVQPLPAARRTGFVDAATSVGPIGPTASKRTQRKVGAANVAKIHLDRVQAGGDVIAGPLSPRMLSSATAAFDTLPSQLQAVGSKRPIQ